MKANEIYKKLKFDIYEKNLETGIEKRLEKRVVLDSFPQREMFMMCGPEAKTIVRGKYEYWAEEAMNYSKGISL